ARSRLVLPTKTRRAMAPPRDLEFLTRPNRHQGKRHPMPQQLQPFTTPQYEHATSQRLRTIALRRRADRSELSTYLRNPTGHLVELDRTPFPWTAPSQMVGWR